MDFAKDLVNKVISEESTEKQASFRRLSIFTCLLVNFTNGKTLRDNRLSTNSRLGTNFPLSFKNLHFRAALILWLNCSLQPEYSVPGWRVIVVRPCRAHPNKGTGSIPVPLFLWLRRLITEQ